MPDVLTLAEQYRRTVLVRDAQAMNRLIRAYRGMVAELQDRIDALALQIGNEQPTLGQLARMTRYKVLLSQAEDRLNDYAAVVRFEIRGSARDLVGMSVDHIGSLIDAYGVQVTFHRLPASAIETLLGFLSDDGPLFARLGRYGSSNASLIRDALVRGLGLGYNPRKLARYIVRAGLGPGLTDVLRMTRTANLYAYREAQRANYLANPNVVRGWVWTSALLPNSCMSCVSLHGTVHPPEERLNDHHNGRCTAVPLVRGAENPVRQSGETWFRAQSETKQRDMMGPGKFDAWRAGRLDFARLTKISEDEVYGLMRIERPLKELIQ